MAADADKTLVPLRSLQNGTTYNSYLIFGGDKTALVDVSHEKFRGLYMPALRAQLQRAGRSLDYLFVSHTEPDHSGAVLALGAASVCTNSYMYMICHTLLPDTVHLSENHACIRVHTRLQLLEAVFAGGWGVHERRTAGTWCCGLLCHSLDVAACAGLVPDVLDLYPEVTVVASKVALAYLKGLTHRPFTERAVKGGDKARAHALYQHLGVVVTSRSSLPSH